MSTVLTGTAGSPGSTVTVPADGEPANATSITTMAQTLINNDKRLLDMRAAASGLAPLDATSKVPAANVTNAIVATYQSRVASYQTLGSSAVVAGTSVAVANVAAGDILLLDGWAKALYTSGTGGTVAIRVASVALAQVHDLTTALTVRAFTARELPAGTGTITCDLYFTAVGAATGDFDLGTLLRVVHIRP